ncbi:MAG: hypothetical protein EBX40_08415 [Gammaproteobacteria bacterium]|nr:hypothetical protein [Gammaproteobacteria bacterium]
MMEIYKNLKNNNKNTIEFSDQILSLPIHPFISKKEMNYLCKTLNKF